MPIKTNLTIDIPAREKFKVEVRLISAGAANSKAFPGGKITIYPWDIQVDDWLLTKGKFQSSKMYDLIPMLCELNGAKVDELFVGDATTILLVARSLRHNSVIEFSPVCPSCGKANKPEKVKVPDQLRKKAEKPDGWNGTDTFTLPVSNDTVTIRPLRVSDEKAIEARSSEEMKQVPQITAHLVAGVVAVGGGTPDSMAEVVNWFRALTPKDQDVLSMKVDELHPRLDNDIEFECDFCQGKFMHTIDLGRPFLSGDGIQLPT